MKARYQLSIALNALLLVALVWEWGARRPSAARPSPPSLKSASVSLQIPKPPEPVRIGGGWRGWIEPLREAQVPPAVLAGLVRADFDQRWQARQAELQEKYMRGEIDADGLAAAGIERETELDQELRAALGAAAYRAWDMDRVLGGLNVGPAQLSEQERGRVYDLERGLQDALRQDQADKLKGAIDNATSQARQKEAQDAVAQKLQDLLGGRRAGMLQGMDDTLGNLRRTLQGEALNENQLEALAESQRQWDRTRSDLVTEQVGTQDPALDSSIQAGADAWRGQFERIAGAQAFDDYQKLQDSRYLDLRRYAPSWGLAPDGVDGIFQTIQDTDDVLQAYRQDATRRGVDTATIAKVEKDFALKTDGALRSELGDKAFGQLEANGIISSQ